MKVGRERALAEIRRLMVLSCNATDPKRAGEFVRGERDVNREDETAQQEYSHRIHSADGCGDFTLWLGYETVVLEKVFGPLIFADIRVRVDFRTCEWVIERATHVRHGDEEDCQRDTWTEVARVAGQTEDDEIGHML